MTFLLLIFGFILIEMPIVAFLSVVNDVHQPLPILIMALICTVIDVIIIIRVLIHHMIREFLAVQEARVVHRVHRLSMTTPIRMIPVHLIVTVQATTQRKNRK